MSETHDPMMLGDRGPFGAVPQGIAGQRCALFTDQGAYVAEVPTDWLTPAPEPEPEEPTAPGALVRDGRGELWVFNPIPGSAHPEWDSLSGRLSESWGDLVRPVTIILADPAEVEAARDEIERLTARIDGALRYVTNPGNWSALDQRQTDLAKTLRGES